MCVWGAHATLRSPERTATRRSSHILISVVFFFFSSRRRHTRFKCDWSSDVCSSDLGLRPIILDEQDDFGMTLIEKFEDYAATCSFAFVLMTPDDKTEVEGKIESQIGRASCRERV